MRIPHGGVSPRELKSMGVSAGRFIDFSVNINPLGTSPSAMDAIARLDPSSYPDPDSGEIREALARMTGVAPGQIVVGNGSTELIYLLAHTYLNKGDRAVILSPTFGEYEAACRLVVAQIEIIHSKEEDGFRWDAGGVGAACRRIHLLRPALTFLCNPNNPTGVYLERAAVAELAAAAGDGLLVLDEAYISFVESACPDSSGLLEMGNLVILRSLTKDHALAGLRLGYALCPPAVADALVMGQPSWSVNAAAQAAGLASLADRAHLSRGVACASEGKRYLDGALRALGLKVTPSAANFLLVEVGDGAEVRRRLLHRGFGVRDCASFGLPRHIRIGARAVPECQKLIAALKEVLGRAS
ncbi:MAG: histidinol-phosphate transaminase [Dehalococcoidia bacterium]|nr:histidinol-phosphate transaminase [Dehalococcoidia bacterium]